MPTKVESQVPICNCSGRDQWRLAGYPKSAIKFKPYDSEGWPLCIFCGSYQNLYCPAFRTHILSRCDTCDQWFKGFKQWVRISYTCPMCEDTL